MRYAKTPYARAVLIARIPEAVEDEELWRAATAEATPLAWAHLLHSQVRRKTECFAGLASVDERSALYHLEKHPDLLSEGEPEALTSLLTSPKRSTREKALLLLNSFRGGKRSR